MLQFQPIAPVYFDRHTLSLKAGRLSMYTLDGRMHFDINLQPTDEARFHNEKLREIVLGSTPQGFRLSFNFSPSPEADAEVPTAGVSAELQEYLLVTAADGDPDIAAVPPPAARAAAPAAALI